MGAAAEPRCQPLAAEPPWGLCFACWDEGCARVGRALRQRAAAGRRVSAREGKPWAHVPLLTAVQVKEQQTGKKAGEVKSGVCFPYSEGCSASRNPSLFTSISFQAQLQPLQDSRFPRTSPRAAGSSSGPITSACPCTPRASMSSVSTCTTGTSQRLQPLSSEQDLSLTFKGKNL